MNIHSHVDPRQFALLALLFFWFSLAMVAQSPPADTLVLVTSQASQGSSDSVSWTQLGADGTLLGASVSATSVSGVATTGTLAGANSVPAVVCAATVCSWTGTGFAAGDTVIWTSDALNGGNGPLTLAFGKSISGAGALIQADGPGQFTAQIQAFNGVTLLGTFTVNSNPNGDAVYIGVKDQTGPNITSVTFSLTVSGGPLTDFALDTAYLNDTVSTTPSTTTLTIAPSTVTLGSSGPVVMTATVAPTSGSGTPTGSVSFFVNGGSAVGSGTLSGGTATFNYNPSALAAATYSVTAQYGGDSTFGASTSSAKTLTVQTKAATATTLTLAPTAVNVGSSGPVVLTATAAPTSGTGTPTGSVTFFVNSVSAGSGTLTSGTATLSYSPSTLAVGNYPVTATYGGDTNFAASTSTAQTLSVQDFTIAATPTTITVTAGAMGTSALTITPLGGFSQTLNYTCTGLPSESSCAFASAGANSETLSIATKAPTFARSWKAPFGGSGNVLYALLLPGLLGLVLPASRRKRTLRHVLPLLAVLAVLTLWLPACSTSNSGGGGNHDPGTPKGTYPITVTAAASGAAGNLSHTATVSLTVQ